MGDIKLTTSSMLEKLISDIEKTVISQGEHFLFGQSCNYGNLLDNWKIYCRVGTGW